MKTRMGKLPLLMGVAMAVGLLNFTGSSVSPPSFTASPAAQAQAVTDASVFVSVPNPGQIRSVNISFQGTRTIERGLADPEFLECGPDGNLYVAEVFAGRITRYSQRGGDEEVIVDFRDVDVTSLAFSPSGDLFFGTRSNGIGVVPDADPDSSPFIVAEAGFNINGMAFFGDDLLVVQYGSSGFEDPFITKIEGPSYDSVDLFIDDDELELPTDIAVNSKGDVFVTDFGVGAFSGQIKKYSSSGTPLGKFATLIGANQIQFDNDDTLFATKAVFAGVEVDGGLFIYPDSDPDNPIVIGGFGPKGIGVCG